MTKSPLEIALGAIKVIADGEGDAQEIARPLPSRSGRRAASAVIFFIQIPFYGYFER